MSAPQYVPRGKAEVVRSYESPPRRPRSWMAVRPGDLQGPGQPSGTRLGRQGPDQGYALRLQRQFEGELVLHDGEREEDALAGCTAVALKRASLFGRAPVVHDLRLALTLFGFLGAPPADLVDFRRLLFEGVAHPHHYVERRHVVDLVPEETLRLTPQDVAGRVGSGWRSLLQEVSVPPAPAPAEALEPAPVEGFEVDAELEAAPFQPVVEDAAVEDAAVEDAAVEDAVVEPVVESEVVDVEPEAVVAPEPEVVDVAPVFTPGMVVVESEPEPEPEPEAVVEPEPEPEPPAPEPVEPPTSEVTVAELVAEAQDRRPAVEDADDDAEYVDSDPEVRARAIEAAAAAHRTRAKDRSEPTDDQVVAAEPPASDEVSGAGAPAEAPPKKVKKIKKIKKIKKVVKKPSAAPDTEGGTGPAAKPPTKPPTKPSGSLFGRPPPDPT